MKILVHAADEPQTIYRRRCFLKAITACGAFGGLAAWAAAEQRRAVTPRQTPGPYYPVPAISKQKHTDNDLTRKLGDDEAAKGEVISIRGEVTDTAGMPLKNAVVEVWQASADGRYNHPRDNNPTPLDPKFQYWGRISTDEEGRYAFKTIKPGEYPGRTPHIHFRVLAPQHRELVTQLYFADEAKRNARDGIYRRLDSVERDRVTTELTRPGEAGKPREGRFPIVLG